MFAATKVLIRMLLVTSMLQLAACADPPIPRGSIEQLFPGLQRPQVSSVQALGRSVQLVQMPGPGHTPIVFIHGSPGSWRSWARYLDAPELSSYGARIAMDRPGFGGSGASDLMLDLRAQAAVLAAAIPNEAPAILVGHSLGGPLIAWMAIDYPEKVCGGVMVAGSVAPELEAPRWYNRLADSWVVQRFLGKDMLLSNREMMVLEQQLNVLDANWARLRRPLIAIQGDKDPLVDPRTADYLEARAPKQWMRIVRAAGMDHFQLWTHTASVLLEIQSLDCPR